MRSVPLVRVLALTLALLPLVQTALAQSGGTEQSEKTSGRKVSVGVFGDNVRPSERTVGLALVWLAKHQTAGGSSRFDPSAGEEKGFANPGTWKSDAGATGLALLPFLGVGQTHESKGPYQRTVYGALYWLGTHQKPDGDLSAGGSPKMLSHALAAFALAEDFGLTADRWIRTRAQKAIDFIAASQDEKTGGWAEPGGRPCMSVSAWQIMALTSGRLNRLKVPPATFQKAAKFLDSLQSEDGATYGEINARDVNDTATIMGRLARMYVNLRAAPIFGSRNIPLSTKPPEDYAAQKEVREQLCQKGPSEADAVLNFYATTFMWNDTYPTWEKWNPKARRLLIGLQAKDGDEAGSWWNPKDPSAVTGGRLLQTALNTMMLEDCYR